MPVEVTDQYIRVQIREPGKFDDDTFRTITLSAEQGIKAIVGRLSGESTMTVLTYLFDKEKWDTDRATAWVKEHKEGKAAEAELLLAEAYKAAGEPPATPVSLDQLTQQIRNAWAQAHGDAEDAGRSWAREVFTDRVIVEKPDGLYAYPYTLDGDRIEFQEPFRVDVEYTPRKSLAIKALSEDEHGATVGGYLLLWGDQKQRDMQGQYFTQKSQLWLDRYPVVPALFHHGLDDTVDLNVVGHRLKATPDERGVWVKHWIDKSNRFWDWIKPLLEAEALYYSPGSANHLTRIDAKTGKILVWPIVEDTLTPIPAQHRLRPAEQIKAAYKSANLALPDLGGDGAETPCLERAQAEALQLSIELALQRLQLD